MFVLLTQTKIAFLNYSDASFAARFVSIIHMLKTPNFSTLICFDRLVLIESYENRLSFPFCLCKRDNKRVGRVLSFFSIRRNWVSPNHSPAGECDPPPLVPGGRAHSLARGGGRVTIPARGHTLWYSIYKCTLWGQSYSDSYRTVSTWDSACFMKNTYEF